MRGVELLVLIALAINVIHAQEVKRTALMQSFDRIFRAPPIQDGAESRAVKQQWIEQKLDNFHENDNRTWKMRYLVNDEHYAEGGPIFIYVGGEWSIESSVITRGHFVDLAKKYKAVLYYTEHRFYGQSRPLDDLSLESLQYLSVKQALADLAYFVEYIRETNTNLANAKVIMSGCSYSASMITWFRRLYPTLIDGGWASSGPLLAKVDFPEYTVMVGQSIKELGGEVCYNRIKNGFAELETLIKDDKSSEIRAMFQVCNKFDQDNDLDLWNLFNYLWTYFASTAQYQKGKQIADLCQDLQDAGSDDTLALSRFILNYLQDNSLCTAVDYKSEVSSYSDNTYTYGNARPWFYQTCNEFGWYQTSTSTNQPFGTLFPKTYYVTMCEDLFGFSNTNLNENVEQTNLDFGGLDPGVSKIYSVHGALDPWSTIGWQSEKGAVRIPGSSHCCDENSLSDSDSEEMKASKKRIDDLIGDWLSR